MKEFLVRFHVTVAEKKFDLDRQNGQALSVDVKIQAGHEQDAVDKLSALLIDLLDVDARETRTRMERDE